MYSFDWTGDFRACVRRASGGATWRRVAPNVRLLGPTSLLTDISSEVVTSVLPLYLVLGLGMSPFLFGVIDGLYPGVTALVRWVPLLFVGTSFVYLLFAFPAGLLAERVPRWRVLLAGHVCLALRVRMAVVAVGATGAVMAFATALPIVLIAAPGRWRGGTGT